MKEDHPLELRGRLLIGGLAGVVGAMAMTAALRWLHRRRPEVECEIAGSEARPLGPPPAGKVAAAAADFAYGAAMGAMIATMNPDPKKRTGAVAGAALWLAGIMNWIPIMGPTEPSPKPRRTLHRLGAHFVWGAATAGAMRELGRARGTIFKGRRTTKKRVAK